MNVLKMSNVNITQMSMIESCILDLQLKDDISNNLDKIKNLLNKNFTCLCNDISISENDTNTLYGMRVYPTQETMEMLASRIIDPKVTSETLTKHMFVSNMQYVIEIDSNLLYNKVYNFKPDEITAILLHEVGHVIADTDFYNDLKSFYTDALFSLENKDLAKMSISKKDITVGMLFIMSSIEKTRFQYNTDTNNRIKLEKLADRFVVKSGYGTPLVAAMNKFNKIYSAHYKKSSRDSLLKNEADAFANLNTIFTTRKNYVETLLSAEERNADSNFVKGILSNVRKYCRKIMLKENVNYVREVPLMDKEFINETFLKLWTNNPLKVSQRDIDDLTIEAEMMEDYNDKSILMFKVHKRLNQVNKAIESNDAEPNTIAIAKSYVRQLNELLKRVMKFNAAPTKYGVFIKYPKGYEG